MLTLLLVAATSAVTVLQVSFGPLLAEVGLPGSGPAALSAAVALAIVDALALLIGLTVILAAFAVIARPAERRLSVLITLAASALLGTACLEILVVLAHLATTGTAPVSPSPSLDAWLPGNVWRAASASNAVLLALVGSGLRRVAAWSAGRIATLLLLLALLMAAIAAVG
ncbi:hypothetical protein [Nocardiopsis rhodophaea]|uniref:hypothetical protein n=1 Tax=Nocardiopsis rhodophaea TaxID=280238 RepID=UPI0031CEE9CD